MMIEEEPETRGQIMAALLIAGHRHLVKIGEV